MQIWVEPFLLLARIESLKSMLFKCLQQNGLSHLQSVVQAHKILVTVILAKLISRDSLERSVQVIYRLQKVLRKSRNREIAGSIDIPFRSVLEVTKVGDGAEIFVLDGIERLSNDNPNVG